MRPTINALQQANAQFAKLAKDFGELSDEEKSANGAVFLLQMNLTRTAIVDLKLDLIAARIMPEIMQGGAPRIVVPE